MLLRLCAALVLAGLLASSSAWALQLNRPQAEYSADSTMQTEDGTIEQHVYATPTKERQEMNAGGETMVQIFRYDTKSMLQLMPSQQMYMEYSLDQASAQRKTQDLSRWDFEETVMGEEVLDGIKVTKYKTIATSSDGKKYGGFSWRTKEGIAVKQDLLYKEGEKKGRLYTELKNLKIGKQDPKLFEVPEGFTKFDMAGMMGGMMGREGMGAPPPDRGQARRPRPAPPVEDAPAPAAPERDQSSGADDIRKAGDMLKKLFGR